jgi:tetratricopeptide (TPR) repeat protein
MKFKIFVTGCLLALLYTSAEAQPGWNWPEDKAKAEEKVALYTDFYKQGNFRRAANELGWLLRNAPDLNKSIYINGVNIYDELATAESDPQKKIAFQDSVLQLYDLRIQYFNEESKVLNRKAFDAYKYFKDEPSKYGDLYALFQNTFKLNGNNVMANNLLAYMDVVRRHKVSGGDISDDDVLGIYDDLVNILDFKITKGKDVDQLNTIREQVDNLLVATIEVDCDFVENTMGPKLQQNQDDLKLAKNILRLSFAGKCMDRPVAIEAAKVVQNHEPEYGIAKLIAQSCASKEDFECAVKYYEESLELTDDNTKKADSYYTLAVISANQKQKSSARDYALKAVQMDPSKKEAYSLIGNLYMGSFNECKQGQNPVDDRAVFLAAYEMFRAAGDNQGMAQAKAQFPTMEEIFSWNMEVGQSIRVGCWINESVAIKKREN